MSTYQPSPLDLWVAAEARAGLARLRLTHCDLAHALHLSEPTCSRLLNGRRPWKLAELSDTADLFDASPLALLPDWAHLAPSARATEGSVR